MKVLHVVPSLALRHGGVSVSVRTLCRALAQIGVEVEVCTTWRAYDPVVDGPADEQLKAAGVTLRYFPVHPWALLGQRYAYSPALGRALAKRIPRVDVVHLHALWLYPTMIAARICQRVKVPYILSPCGALDPYSMRRHGLFKRLYGFLIERHTLAGAATWHFTSELEQRQAETFGVNQPSVVIPRAAPLEDIPDMPPGAFRRRHPEVGQRHILLFLGRLHPKKRPDLVAEAFITVARRRDDVHLVLAGPDDGAASSVRDHLRRADLLNRATFTGLLDAVAKWEAIRDSAILLLPSEEENFGMAVLEAMAAGVPVVVSPQVGLADVVASAGAGLVVDRDVAAWAAAIERLLRDPAVLTAMGEAGRRTTTMFRADRVATAVRETYATVARTRHGSTPS